MAAEDLRDTRLRLNLKEMLPLYISSSIKSIKRLSLSVFLVALVIKPLRKPCYDFTFL